MYLFLVASCFPLSVFSEVLFPNGSNFHEGGQCTLKGENLQGTCVPIQKCLEGIKKSMRADICGFIGKDPIVCCLSSGKNASTGPPLPTNSTAFNTSHNSTMQNDTLSAIAWSKAKCKEFPPPKGSPFIVGSGGQRSLAQEFSHMAILGFGNETDIIWRCGGSLISHQHVLTAAHCLYSSDLGKVKYVRLGDLDILDDREFAEPQDFTVKVHVQHPEFDLLTLKHDIAILVLDKPVRLSDYVTPACLFTGGVIQENDHITATGWGITKYAGELSSHLMKFSLKIVNNTDCRKQYEKVGTTGLIDADSQVCAGSADPTKIVDTCEGDSGGPLQLTEYSSRRHFIIGITSFGKTACGLTKSVGVYTNVTSHIPWIKMTVINYS